MARSFSTGNNLSVGNPAALQITGSDFTMAAFCHPTGLPAAANVQLCAKRGANITQIAYEMGFWSQKLRFALSDAANYDFCESGVLGANPGVLHCVGMKQAGNIRNYINGANTASVASAHNIANTGAGFWVGRDDTGQQITARIAEVAVWAKALSDAEVLALSRGICPLFIRRDFLRGYWPIFGNASPEADLSGNKNNATLVGTPAQADHFLMGKLAA